LASLLYICYGNNPLYLLEMSYSVVSAVQAARRAGEAPPHILLLAEPHNLRPDLPVESVAVDAATTRAWQLGGRFHFAFKLHALRAALARTGGPVVLIDNDTIFRAPPSALFARVGPGRSLLHVDEGPVRAVPEGAALVELLARPGRVPEVYPTPETHMFNSGITGVDPADAATVDAAIDLVGALLDRGEVFTLEQLSISAVLAARTRVAFADDLVEHYWSGARRWYHYQLARMFPADEPGRLAALLAADSLPPLTAAPAAGLRPRLAARLARLRRGGDGAYGHAVMAARAALAARARDGALAEVWAGIAADTLLFGQSRPLPSGARADFAAFAPGRIAATGDGWLREATRRRWSDAWARLDGAQATAGGVASSGSTSA